VFLGNVDIGATQRIVLTRVYVVYTQAGLLPVLFYTGNDPLEAKSIHDSALYFGL